MNIITFNLNSNIIFTGFYSLFLLSHHVSAALQKLIFSLFSFFCYIKFYELLLYTKCTIFIADLQAFYRKNILIHESLLHVINWTSPILSRFIEAGYRIESLIEANSTIDSD